MTKYMVIAACFIVLAILGKLSGNNDALLTCAVVSNIYVAASWLYADLK